MYHALTCGNCCLNTNIFILDYVRQFPFDLFTAPDESLFFRIVFENFFDVSLLIITRITTDQGSDVFTLPRFKNRIRQCIRDERQASFDARLRDTRFDRETKLLLERAVKLRNERVAHVAEDIALGKADDTEVTFDEIRSLRDKLNLLLDTLSFNVEHMMLPIQYSPNVQHPPGAQSKPDIEAILDSIAYRSILLNMPEENPQLWAYKRKRLPNEKIDILNWYRRKFNLPEV